MKAGWVWPVGALLIEVATCCVAHGADAGATPVTLAVLSEARRDWNTPEITIARIVFRRAERGWEAVERTTASAPQGRTTWRVCFDGHRLGDVATEPAPDLKAISLARVHQLVAGERAPWVGARSTAFSGWMRAATHHPVVLDTADTCADPEHWKRSSWPTGLLAQVLPALKKAVAAISRCDKDGHISGPYELGRRDVIMGDAYVSSRGDRIVTVSVRATKEVLGPCLDEMLDDNWSPQTFAVLANGTVQHLGSSMRVLDSGDYDADGRSGIIFQFERYDYDGYTLFWNGFDESVSYGWHYH